MTPSEKLSAIYNICQEAKDEGFIEESVIDQILRIVTFDNHDYLSDELIDEE